MDQSDKLNLNTMPSQGKCSNIYINPKFNETVKNVIHINPKVHVNMAIHVNPRMVNALSPCGLRQLQQSQIRQLPQTTRELPKPNIQKSIYVNPKLMEKLKTKVPDVVKKEQKPSISTSKPQIISGPTTPQLKSKKIFVNKNIIQKLSPTNLVSLSKRKLVRVRVLAKSSGGSEKTLKSPLKPVALNRSKKFNLVDRRVILNKSKTNLKISSSSPSASTTSRYKIDRTGPQKKKIKVKSSSRKTGARVNTNLIKIDGVLYKSSKSQLVKSNNSSNRSSDLRKRSSSSIAMNNSRKLLRMKSTIAKTIINRYSTSNVVQKSNYKYILSNRAKQKSIQILRHKMTKNNQPCLLFQRFGYCAKYTAGTCPKVHDKKQVALCKKFLQGQCLLDNCPLSHDIGPEKMPTCKYFLDGCCIRDACPYLHVKVSANTPICVSFLQGYCAKGNKCKERHTNICPEFEKIGKCGKGKNCPYPHKKNLLAKHRCPSQNMKKITFNKQRVLKKKTPKSLPKRDESVKRYYDDNCHNLISSKRMRLIEKINIMKTVHSESETNSHSILPDSTVNINNLHQEYEEHSQPCHQNLQYKRPPIGPLPSYIPIE